MKNIFVLRHENIILNNGLSKILLRIPFIFYQCAINHSDKKQKDSPEGSLVLVLFAAELEFPKILVPTLPQNTSNHGTIIRTNDQM